MGIFNPPRISNPIAYLFVDGAYLRERYRTSMTAVFGIDGDLDVRKIYDLFTRELKRVFYYDCLQDIQCDGEDDSNFRSRVAEQEERFEQIQLATGYHVRLGSLSGTSKKIRQKKVDVLLAVEALDHAARKNMEVACLLAGDLDFVPVVESLVRMGTWVEVIYDPRSAARHLYLAADGSHKLGFERYYDWSTDSFRNSHPIPTRRFNESIPAERYGELLKVGKTSHGEYVALGERPGEKFLYVQSGRWGGSNLVLSHPNVTELERYFVEAMDGVEWKGE